ncbi:hypothetical protein [Nitratireductor sp. GCM10026969]|uniref:hypothetical protein n=1 Tax=Nitratireductor sp. GCM10026969 TaxID=3252645 RepID=UPI00360641F5
MTNILNKVREGMRVFDAQGDEIGTVEWVKMSDEDPTTPETETATPGTSGARRAVDLTDLIADAFRTDDVPETLQGRLLREGFVRVDAKGLFAADRYILPDQISSVSNERVTLNASRDELVRSE